MSFWVRRIKATDLTLVDLSDTVVPGSGGEVDLHATLSDDLVQSSMSLTAAFLTGDLVRITGSGGSQVTLGAEFDSLTAQIRMTCMKAGTLSASLFSGTPKKATVQFNFTLYSTDYSVDLLVQALGPDSCTAVVEDKTVTGFTINLGTDSVPSLTKAQWSLLPSG